VDARSAREVWVDRLKGLALIWIFLNHASEELWDGFALGNPCKDWPPLSSRLDQLRPVEGHGVWGLPLNLFRYVGLLGDQGVALFLIASGFGLAWSLAQSGGPGAGGWKEFYFRRLFRIYPLWWAVHAHVVLKWCLGRLPGEGRPLLLSLAGIRIDGATFYYHIAAWWFVGLLVQLYVLFPLLWICLRKLGPLRFLLGSAVLAALARGVGMLTFSDYIDPWLRGSVFITRLPEFAAGMSLAVWLRENRDATQALLCRGRSVLLSAGLYLLGTGLSITWWGMTVAPLLVGLGILGMLYPLLNRGSRSGALAWLGVHSYAIYLVHSSVVIRLLHGSTSVSAGVVLRILAAAGLSVLIGVALEWVFARAETFAKGWRARSRGGGSVTGSAGA